MSRSEANTVWNLSSFCPIECGLCFHDEDAKFWSQTGPSGYVFLHVTPESPDCYLPGHHPTQASSKLTIYSKSGVLFPRLQVCDTIYFRSAISRKKNKR